MLFKKRGEFRMEIENLLGLKLAEYVLEKWYKVFRCEEKETDSNSTTTTNKPAEVSSGGYFHGYFRTIKEAEERRDHVQKRTRGTSCHIQEVIVLTKDGWEGFLIGTDPRKIQSTRLR